jgi:hypothetical protein
MQAYKAKKIQNGLTPIFIIPDQVTVEFVGYVVTLKIAKNVQLGIHIHQSKLSTVWRPRSMHIK